MRTCTSISLKWISKRFESTWLGYLISWKCIYSLNISTSVKSNKKKKHKIPHHRKTSEIQSKNHRNRGNIEMTLLCCHRNRGNIEMTLLCCSSLIHFALRYTIPASADIVLSWTTITYPDGLRDTRQPL